MLRFLSRWESIDPRWLYVALAMMVALPLYFKLDFPIPVSRETQMAYDAIDAAPKEKLILIESDWDQGSQGENWGQTQAIVEHLMKTDRKFAFVSAIPTAPTFAEKVANLVAKKYNKRYGVDWVNWGFKIPLAAAGPAVQSLSRDIPKAVEKDINGTPITDYEKLPIMRGIKDINDVALVVNVAYDVRLEWIQLVQGVYGTPLISCCASITSTTNYPLLDTRQLSGMLVGVRGAAEYEQLVNAPDRGTKLIKSQSLGHLLLLIGVVIGNIGYYARRKLAKTAPAEGTV